MFLDIALVKVRNRGQRAAVMLVSCNVAPWSWQRWLLRTVALAPTKMAVSKGSTTFRKAQDRRSSDQTGPRLRSPWINKMYKSNIPKCPFVLGSYTG